MFRRELTRVIILGAIGLIIGLVLMGSGQSTPFFNGYLGLLIPIRGRDMLLISPFYMIGLIYGAKYIIAFAISSMKAWVISLLHCRSWIALLIVIIIPLFLLPLIMLIIWIPGCFVAAKELMASYERKPKKIRMNNRSRIIHQLSRPTSKAPSYKASSSDNDFDF